MNRFFFLASSGAVAFTLLGAGCLASSVDTSKDGGASDAANDASDASTGDGPTKNDGKKDAIFSRDRATSPGCTTEGLDTRSASSSVPAVENHMGSIRREAARTIIVKALGGPS